jgi:hypothetical protein
MSPETIATIGAVSNIATTAGVIVGLTGLLFVWLQIRHGVLARETSVCLGLAQFSSSTEFSHALMTVLNADTKTNAASIDTKTAIQVCVFFELVGSIVNHGYMSTKLIQEFYGTVISDAHNRLKGFIDEYRKQTQRSEFCVNFEKLANTIAKN